MIGRLRGIGARLYLALALSVLLTFFASAMGVFYFERSGDLNYVAEQESVPVMVSSWKAAHAADRIRIMGLSLMLEPNSSVEEFPERSVEDLLSELEVELGHAASIPGLRSHALAVQDAAYELVTAIDNLAINRAATLEANGAMTGLQSRLDSLAAEGRVQQTEFTVLQRAIQAGDVFELNELLQRFNGLSRSSLDPAVASLADGQGVFALSHRQLALMEQRQEIALDFSAASSALEANTVTLLNGATAHSSQSLGLAVQSFDQGRIVLATVCVISVIAASLVSWLWVSNAVVRRLSRLSQRMLDMAGGDLDTEVPEVSNDEIGQLAEALEVFRQQALEVQRLNLVEQLYGELREANAEMQRMQARLVAQEKLASLGELVSGVAHEISNPLNFVQNFAKHPWTCRAN